MKIIIIVTMRHGHAHAHFEGRSPDYQGRRQFRWHCCQQVPYGMRGYENSCTKTH